MKLEIEMTQDPGRPGSIDYVHMNDAGTKRH